MPPAVGAGIWSYSSERALPERHPDDLEPAIQPVESERAQVVRRCAENGLACALGRFKRIGDGGQELVHRALDRVAHRRLPLDGFAEKPRAVADVALLVVVDLRVSVDEAGEQPFVFEKAGGELERRQTEGALDDLVIERDEDDLCLDVSRIADEPVVRGHELVVENRAERRRDLVAGALDMLGYQRGLAYGLVLKARVELHVTCLVDLLRGQERRLLLAVEGADEARELGRDPLLRDHQRSEHERHERGVRDRLPLLPVAREVDSPRRPLAFLPVPVQRLRVEQMDFARHVVIGFRARMIAAPACSWTRCVSRISMSARPAAASSCANCARVSAPAMHPVHFAMSARVASSISGSAITSLTAKRPPGRRTRAVSRSTFALSPERLMTQLEITTWTLSSGSGMSSMYPFRNSTFATPASLALRRASASISSVMSSPIARPFGATRRALMSTSAPAPAPRSSTVSPAFKSATAVGTPQPSEPASASALVTPVCVSPYSASPNTCEPRSSLSAISGPQHAAPSAPQPLRCRSIAPAAAA